MEKMKFCKMMEIIGFFTNSKMCTCVNISMIKSNINFMPWLIMVFIFLSQKWLHFLFTSLTNHDVLRHRQTQTNFQTKIHAVFRMKFEVWKIICWLSLHFIWFRFIFKYSNLFGINILLLNGSVFCFFFFLIHSWYEMRKRAKNSIEVDVILNVPYWCCCYYYYYFCWIFGFQIKNKCNVFTAVPGARLSCWHSSFFVLCKM